jgi:hypothetical protein
MAVTMIGGLVSSTVFTLVALPVWYTTVEDLGSVAWRCLPRLRGRPRAEAHRRRGVLVGGPPPGC